MKPINQSDAFERAVRAHGGLVARIAASYEHDRHRIDDLVQEAFLGFWRALPSFRGDASAATFLARITHNVCVSHVRRAVREPVADHDPTEAAQTDPGDGPASTADRHERRAALMRAIRSMPLPLRQVVTLHLEGFTGREIAEALEISENNAAVRLTRARAELRRKLGGVQ